MIVASAGIFASLAGPDGDDLVVFDQDRRVVHGRDVVAVDEHAADEREVFLRPACSAARSPAAGPAVSRSGASIAATTTAAWLTATRREDTRDACLRPCEDAAPFDDQNEKRAASCTSRGLK